MTAPQPIAPLRVAALCGLTPLLLGSVAFFGWLLWTGGKSDQGRAFQLLGVVALSAGPALFLIGLIALAVARRRGGEQAALRNRLLLLLANLPLALLYFAGLSVAAIQRVEVINRSGRPIDELTLIACRTARCEVGALAPGERYVWRFTPPAEGTLSLTGRQGDAPLALDADCMFFVFDRVDVTLELQASGEWTLRAAPGAPWSWIPGR